MPAVKWALVFTQAAPVVERVPWFEGAYNHVVGLLVGRAWVCFILFARIGVKSGNC